MKKSISIIVLLLVFVSANASSYKIVGKGESGSIKCSGYIYESSFNNAIVVNVNDMGEIKYSVSDKTLIDDRTIRWRFYFQERSFDTVMKEYYCYKQKCSYNNNVFFFAIPNKNGSQTVYKTIKE